MYGGYATFVVSILMIGACTAVIGDVAGHLGCFILLKDTVNAIAFVALGTSVPGNGGGGGGGTPPSQSTAFDVQAWDCAQSIMLFDVVHSTLSKTSLC